MGRVDSKAVKTRLALILGHVVVYVVVYTLLSPALGSDTAILATLPIVMAGVFFGLRGGLLAGILALPLNVSLVQLAADMSWSDWVRQDGALVTVTLILVGTLTGWLRDINKKVNGDITDNEKAIEEGNLDNRQLDALAKIGRISGKPASFEERATRVLEELAQIWQADRVTIRVADENQQGFRLVAAAGPGLPSLPPSPLLRYGESISRALVQEGHPVVANDYATHPGASPANVALGIKSLFTLPISVGEDTLGLVNIASRKANHFTPRRTSLVAGIEDGLRVLFEHARLHEDVRDKDAEIQCLKRFNDRIISSIPTALAILKGSERVTVSANRTFYQVLGLDESEVDGRPITEALSFVSLEEAFNEPNLKEGATAQKEVSYVHPDGSERWITVSTTPLELEHQSLLIINDITDQKQSQERLQETARLASVGELTAGVAHELNNPLAAVLGLTQLLMARELSPSTSEDVLKIYEQAQRASKVVQNLLSFARKHQPERLYTDITATIRKTMALMVYAFNVNNIRVNLDLPPDIPHTMADERQLKQVFLNILVNAEQAMVDVHNGGTLGISAQKVGDNIRLSFADDGPGIPSHYLNRIFDPFFTTKEVGKGTGLGLSICHGIIHEHMGKIWAESQPRQGTTFHIELPILHPDTDPGAFASVAGSKSPLKLRILVVDDEPVIRDLLFQVLSGSGHIVDTAKDGREAWRMIHEVPYECLVVDLKMPGISGQELYYLIKDFGPDLASKVIFITGDTSRPEVRSFLQTTGNTVMGKPLNLGDLGRRISELAEGG